MDASTQARACHKRDPRNPQGTCGAALATGLFCLGHLTRGKQITYLADLDPGSDINVRGVTFTGGLLAELLAALEDDRGRPQIGAAVFDGAQFLSAADFDNVTFSKSVSFNNVNFRQDVTFTNSTFESDTFFQNGHFEGEAWFANTTFCRNVHFRKAEFARRVSFFRVLFTHNAIFDHATFRGPVEFSQATAGLALLLKEARVEQGLHMEMLAKRIEAAGLRGEHKVNLLLRGTEVDVTDVTVAGPLVIHGLQRPIFGTDESKLLDTSPKHFPAVGVLSLRGVFATTVTLTDVDLRNCRFTGLHHADQLVLDGQCLFVKDPKGRRRVLVEECHWRAQEKMRHGDSTGGWTAAQRGVDVVGPSRLEVIYRQLRKALEDGKNEPGAADFYYGEMEMRRATAKHQRRMNRLLLNVYWATSGYALRVRRTLTYLGLVIAATIIALTMWGFPSQSRDLKADGTLASPGVTQSINVTVHESEPIKKLGDRIDRATEIALNASIFRAADTELTTAGRYVDIAARLLGPLFLGLSVLAVRNRVKR